ncbi:MAG: hypothetical protein HY871_06240 [Chloroflexi bacterium]|nr:hypothetical protein [Chloroflexota bacterium]
MSHDARWFMAVAQMFGIETANRLNQTAAHEEGKVEAQRIVRALNLPSIASISDYLLVQEIIIGLLGPDLLDYRVVEVDEAAYQVHVQRCFAHENVSRVGLADQYECGVFARITGWLEALGLQYQMSPSLGKCLKAQGRECLYTFRFERESLSGGVPGR